MAISPKESITPPTNPTKERKDNIGSFYLSLNLEYTEEKDVDVYPFVAINQYISEKMHVSIPDSLIKDLGLNSLNWITHYHAESLPRLFLGKTKKNDLMFERSNLNNVVSSIEIARKTDYSSGKGKVIPFYLRIAGIYKVQNRIVTATYDLENQNRLEELNVSFASKEYFRESPSINTGRVLTTMPSRFDRPYDTAALTTKEMVKHVQRLDNPGVDPRSIFPLMDGVVFSRTDEGFFLGNHLMYVDLEKQSKYASDSGYYIKQEDGNLTVGLLPGSAEQRKIKPWEISMPEFLPKA